MTPAFILSLSAELAREADDLRRQTARRWQAAVHRLCVLRAAHNATTFETEWPRIFEHERLMEDLRQPSKQLALAALEAMEVQNEMTTIVCGLVGIPLEDGLTNDLPEALAALRYRLVNDLH